MFRIPFLRNILLLTLLLCLSLPLYAVVIIHPSFSQLLMEEAEGEAILYVRTLIRTLNLEGVELERNHIPENLTREIGILQGNVALVKLRVFSPAGEIVFSTAESEIGTRNTKDYFREKVARGQIFSKTVNKGGLSAEQQPVAQTVVETYVPLMHKGRFVGAVETYFDITLAQEKMDALTRRSSILLFATSACLLLAILVALRNARNRIQEKEAAEETLRDGNLILEKRVAERTEQILESNRLLTEEITIRRRTEKALGRALEESEMAKNRIDGILHSVPDGLLVTDEQGCLLLLNPTAEQVLGIRLDENLGRPLEQVLPHHVPTEKLLTILAQSGADGQIDLLVPTANEADRVFQARTSLLPDREGAAAGKIVLLREITRERQAEQSKRDFIAMAAHELQSPLTVVLGYAEMLIGDDPGLSAPTEHREILHCIYDQAQTLSRLVDDLLEISRVESGQILSLEKSVFPVGKLLHKAVTAARADSRYRFELNLVSDEVHLHADQGRIHQVLANLLSNAVKFSPPGGRILVRGELQHDHYLISVADEGMGMTLQQQASAFEKYFRADSVIRAVRGSGLGLSISRSIVEAHGGTIALVSEAGQGTRIWFTIPLAAPSSVGADLEPNTPTAAS